MVFLIFFGLLAAMIVVGTYRYFMEKRAVLSSTHDHGEQADRRRR